MFGRAHGRPGTRLFGLVLLLLHKYKFMSNKKTQKAHAKVQAPSTCNALAGLHRIS